MSESTPSSFKGSQESKANAVNFMSSSPGRAAVFSFLFGCQIEGMFRMARGAPGALWRKRTYFVCALALACGGRSVVVRKFEFALFRFERGREVAAVVMKVELSKLDPQPFILPPSFSGPAWLVVSFTIPTLVALSGQHGEARTLPK